MHVHIRILPRTCGLLARARTQCCICPYRSRGAVAAYYHLLLLRLHAIGASRSIFPGLADRPVSHTRFTGNHKLVPILNNKIDDYARARPSFILKFAYTSHARTQMIDTNTHTHSRSHVHINTGILYACGLWIRCAMRWTLHNTHQQQQQQTHYYSTIKMFIVCVCVHPFSPRFMFIVFIQQPWCSPGMVNNRDQRPDQGSSTHFNRLVLGTNHHSLEPCIFMRL